MINELRQMPWRVKNEGRRMLAYPYIRAAFAYHGVAWGNGWRILGMPIIQRHRKSEILLGDGLSLRSWPRTNPLVPNHPVVLATRKASAVIRIGKDCGLTGTTIVAAEEVVLGDRVLIGANVTVADTDFQPLTPEGRAVDINAGKHAPIHIGDDVFVGMNSLILKGVTIGQGSVVGAGSVVTRDVPARTIVAGNPARIVSDVH
jgi:acetyltransferase-like isoleucine patch superfamily enzyme